VPFISKLRPSYLKHYTFSLSKFFNMSKPSALAALCSAYDDSSSSEEEQEDHVDQEMTTVTGPEDQATKLISTPVDSGVKLTSVDTPEIAPLVDRLESDSSMQMPSANNNGPVPAASSVSEQITEAPDTQPQQQGDMDTAEQVPVETDAADVKPDVAEIIRATLDFASIKPVENAAVKNENASVGRHQGESYAQMREEPELVDSATSDSESDSELSARYSIITHSAIKILPSL
jgi:hypothetical protein